MRLLNVKVQYKNFEAGEFVDEKERTYEEAIGLIRKFPWNQQRENLQVSLTNSSITLDLDKKSYLKLVPYYNQNCFDT